MEAPEAEAGRCVVVENEKSMWLWRSNRSIISTVCIKSHKKISTISVVYRLMHVGRSGNL